MTRWLDRKSALAALGVRAQTLYAYVSRGRIMTMADPADPRRSLYRAEDVLALLNRRARGRNVARIAESTISWGEPSIVTSISTVKHGRLIYRGEDAVEWAAKATLEETAALLWQSRRVKAFTSVAAAADPYQALAGLLPASKPMLERDVETLAQEAQAVVGHISGSLGVENGSAPLHVRIAKQWSLNESDTERVRQVLVLLADHELNASTFATRVAASTGASMSASLLAGLCTWTGPRHGGASNALMTLLGEAHSIGAAPGIAAWLARGQQLPGFGHPLYPEGDVRASTIMATLRMDRLCKEILQAALHVTGHHPNIDFALVAFARACKLPQNAPMLLFVLARSIGWAAHAIEQVITGQLIRPRARYVAEPAT